MNNNKNNNERQNTIKRVVKTLIKNGSDKFYSITGAEIIEALNNRHNIKLSRSRMYKIIGELMAEGEKIISLRSGLLKGYRYARSNAEFNLCITENQKIINSYDRKIGNIRKNMIRG